MTLDARDIVSRLSKSEHNPTPRRNGFRARCPVHMGDSDDSLSITERDHGEGVWLHCFAGCDYEQILDALGVEPDEVWENGGHKGYTLDDYARDKNLDLDVLRELGLKTVERKGDLAVQIPYFDQNEDLASYKYRTADSFWWQSDPDMMPYGLWRLDQNDTVVIVEGESDCHALWHAGVNAIGIPGSNSWRSRWANYLDCPKYIIWKEPDEAGTEFVRTVLPDLPENRSAVYAPPEGVKDPAEVRSRGENLRRFLKDTYGDCYIPSREFLRDPPEVAQHFVPMDKDFFSSIKRKSSQEPEAVPTPWPTLHSCCGDQAGYQGIGIGWHALLAGMTSAGKSLAALQLTLSALREGHNVCYLSNEMSKEQVASRILAQTGEATMPQVTRGTHFDESQIDSATKRVLNAPGTAYVNRKPVTWIDQIIDLMQWFGREKSVDLFIIDYLQLVGASGEHVGQRMIEVSESLFEAAKEHGVASVALSQYSSGQSPESPPNIHHLYGGRALAQRADIVIQLDHYNRVECPTENRTLGHIDVAKNRHGPQKVFPVMHDFDHLRMDEMDPSNPPIWVPSDALRGDSEGIKEFKEAKRREEPESESEEEEQWGQSSSPDPDDEAPQDGAQDVDESDLPF